MYLWQYYVSGRGKAAHIKSRLGAAYASPTTAKGVHLSLGSMFPVIIFALCSILKPHDCIKTAHE